MAAQVVPFTFQEQHSVRVTVINDDPWFCLRDVCVVLEIKNQNPDRFQLDSKGVTRNVTPTSGGEQEVTFINEPNLYRVIFRSNKPEAKAFQDWVFNDVLPAIRQHGAYVQPAPPVPTRTREPISPAKYYELKSLVHDISGCPRTARYPPANTLLLAWATTEPQLTGSPMRPRLRPLTNTVPLPMASRPSWHLLLQQCTAYWSLSRTAPLPLTSTLLLAVMLGRGGQQP